MTGLLGEPVDFSSGTELSNAGLVVSNGRIHERVIAATTRVTSPLPLGEG